MNFFYEFHLNSFILFDAFKTFEGSLFFLIHFMESENISPKTFIKHVFEFDEDSKGDVFNIIQYSLLAIIPIVGLNKMMQKWVPEANEEKGTLEILAEILLQVVGTFVGLFFINRLITFIPTFSQKKYSDFNVLNIILAVLMIILSLQTKLGEKVAILADRAMELWEGKSDGHQKKANRGEGNGKIHIKQPLSNLYSQGIPIDEQARKQAMYTDGTLLNQLPDSSESHYSPANPLTSPPSYPPSPQSDMPYANGANGGAPPLMDDPMPANVALGGSAFGTW
jgi:hypothetical protein